MKRPAILISLLALLLAPALMAQDPLGSAYLPSIDTNPADYPANIWVTDTMQKIRQDSGSPGTQHWGTFYGTQNEFVDFQVHVQAPAGGYSALNITVGNFVQTSPNSSTINCATLGQCIVYREGYIHVTTVSSTRQTFYGVTGFYPDPLIPATDPYTSQVTNAWPFAQTANLNQSAWIDIHIPPSAPSGYYLGSVTVKNGVTTLTTLPIIIAVWQWPSSGHMPSTSSLPSDIGSGGGLAQCAAFYGSYSACSVYPGAGGNSDVAQSLTNADSGAMFLDHRWGYWDQPYAYDNFSRLETIYGPYLLGNGLGHYATLLSGAQVTEMPILGNQPSDFQSWVTEWQNRGYSAILTTYSADEPSTSGQWTQVNTWGVDAHATTPPLSAMVTLGGNNFAAVTTQGATGNIDVWVALDNTMDQVPYSGDPSGGPNNRSTYAAWLTGSSGPTRRLWDYGSCSSMFSCSNGTPDSGATGGYANYGIDGKPAANRAREWTTYLYQESGELYYDPLFCWGQASNCNGNADPWNGSYAFGGNGEGTLFYPSVFGGVNHTGTTNPHFVPSVRMKHMRDGMQDYEYMHELTTLGQGAAVSTQIATWMTRSWSFELTGTGLQAARQNLGTLLHQQTYALGSQTVYYYAQTSAGGNNGQDCADAYAFNDATKGWTTSTPWVAGNVINICGTITGSGTSMMTVAASGAAGNVITVKWQPGARLSQTHGGIINLNGQSYLLFDGGTPCGYTAAAGDTACATNDTGTGIIEATQNGTGRAFQDIQTQAFYNESGGGNVEVRNLIIRNLYVHVCGTPFATACTSDGTVSAETGTFAFQCASGNAGCAGPITIHDSALHDIGVPISMQHFTSSPQITLYNLKIYNHNWGVENSGSGVRSLTIHDVHFGSTTNWDTAPGTPNCVANGDCYHHNSGVHSFMTTSSQMNLFLYYNNLSDGIASQNNCCSTSIFLFNDNDFPSNMYLFNNVIIQDCSGSAAPAINYGSSSVTTNNTNWVANNTFIGCPTTSGNTWTWQFSGGLIAMQNNLNQGFGQYVKVNANAVTAGFGTIDYNAYGVKGLNGNAPWQCGTTGEGTFAGWQTCDTTTPDAHGFTTTNANIQTVFPYQPNAGSPLQGTGHNLTSTYCATVVQLCTDRNGLTRPATAAWDIGAAQSTGTPIPGVPTSLTAAVTGSNVGLNWTPSTGTVVNYAVFRSTTNGGPYTQIATPTATSYTDSNLAAGIYYYVVQACNVSGCSANSTQVSATVQSQVTVPGVPANLVATVSNNTQANLTWSASSGTPVNYKVFRGTSSSGPFTLLATVTALMYSDVGLANGTYWYTVQGCNTAGCSTNATPASVTIATAPAANVAPSMLAFGNTVIGVTAAAQTVTLTSTGTASLTYSSATISGANAADYSIASTTCSPGTMAIGALCTFNITFTPSAAGTRSASLVVTTNDPTGPDSVSLSGNGIVGITVNPTSLSFGSQFLNKTSNALSVTFTNLSGSTVTFSSVALSVGTQYTISANACTGTLTTGSHCVTSVTFTPTSQGNKADTLTYTFTGPSGSPITVGISGVGKKHGVLKVGAGVSYHVPPSIELIKTVLRPWQPVEETVILF